MAALANECGGGGVVLEMNLTVQPLFYQQNFIPWAAALSSLLAQQMPPGDTLVVLGAWPFTHICAHGSSTPLCPVS